MIQSSEHMARPTVSQRSGRSRWQQWWRRSPNSCCSKRILLLLVWHSLFSFSLGLLQICGFTILQLNLQFLRISQALSLLLAPFVGWLADFKVGRYEIIRFGSIISFSASVFCYFALFTGGVSCSVLFMAAMVLVSLGSTCFTAAMLPFLSDQLIGATSDELSAALQWYIWADMVGFCLSTVVSYLIIIPTEDDFSCEVSVSNVKVAGIYAVPLALIIISDCLCLQWLNRTHKVTNPIKLIIQVLNYTRKHKYPERRSAFTYLDEEQPSRMDFGKEKFGGPFTEEKVEDVKTFLRLILLIVCFVLSDSIAHKVQIDLLKPGSWINDVVNFGMTTWMFHLILIPFYRFLLYYVFHKHIPSMLKCIAAGLLMTLVGFILLDAVGLYSVFRYDDIQRYLSCTQLNATVDDPDYNVDWYWKLGPFLLYGTGRALAAVSFYVFIIAQSPDKMKGLAVGLLLAVQGAGFYILTFSDPFVFTLCFDVLNVVPLVVLFAIFLLLSKWYTLRERNREINIQAIVEEHYERYMDQEEKYEKEHGTNSVFDSDIIYSVNN